MQEKSGNHTLASIFPFPCKKNLNNEYGSSKKGRCISSMVINTNFHQILNMAFFLISFHQSLYKHKRSPTKDAHLSNIKIFQPNCCTMSGRENKGRETKDAEKTTKDQGQSQDKGQPSNQCGYDVKDMAARSARIGELLKQYPQEWELELKFPKK